MHYIHLWFNFIELCWSKIYLYFGGRYTDKVIPTGLYCYYIGKRKHKTNTRSIYFNIRLCPYYKRVSKNWNGCKYTGTITNDIVFDDHCKICNKKNV